MNMRTKFAKKGAALLIFHLLASVWSFNIDTNYPIVVHDAFSASNAHFGASVLLIPSQVRNEGPMGW